MTDVEKATWDEPAIARDIHGFLDFCDNDFRMKSFARAPFLLDGKTIATDGVIIIAVESDDRFQAAIEGAYPIKEIREIFKEVGNHGNDYSDLDALGLDEDGHPKDLFDSFVHDLRMHETCADEETPINVLGVYLKDRHFKLLKGIKACKVARSSKYHLAFSGVLDGADVTGLVMGLRLC